MRILLFVGLLVWAAGCGKTPAEKPVAAASSASTIAAPAPKPIASALNGQRGQGQPYEIIGSQVWDVPDPKSGRNYQVFVAVPPSYNENSTRRYPVLYVTDADYAFPLIRQISRRLNLDAPKIDEFILVGLSYAIGENGAASRRRDYTPTTAGAKGDLSSTVHGMGSAYTQYLRDEVLPFVAQRYRTDERQRNFLGHSYGSLLGTQILLSAPEMFAGYILGSPSYWYDPQHIESLESTFAANHKDLQARVYMYVGQFEDMKPGDARYATRYNMVTDARRMTKTLRARHYPSLQLQLDVLQAEDHLSVAPSGFTYGLKYLLGTSAH